MECRLALEIAEQVASALSAAEKRRLVHRDIKPSNLMLVREGDGDVLVKVIDFGLVKLSKSRTRVSKTAIWTPATGASIARCCASIKPA